MSERLPAHVEAAAIIRRTETGGGFAAVLRKGDPDRGTLTMILRERGEFLGVLERELGPDFVYNWAYKEAGEQLSSANLDDFIVRKERFDPVFWLIELDIAEPERFIAETTRTG